MHISWFIAWLSFGVLAGAGLSAFATAPFSSGQLYIIAAMLAGAACLKRIKVLCILMLLAGVAVGMARGTDVQRQLYGYWPYIDKNVAVQGTVSEDVAFGPKGDQRLLLKNVRINNTALPGRVWVSTDNRLELRRSDIVTVDGRLSDGFGNLPASMFRAHVSAAKRPIHGDIALDLRDWFASGVRKAIAEPESSLGLGYLLGQRSALPQTLDDQLRVLGLMHIVVASGYNLTILMRFARKAFQSTSKYLAAVSAAAMTCGFVLVTGFSPSMTRAALVTGLSLAAWYFGRKIQPVIILVVAAAVTALYNPAYTWGDIGWCLSFAAFAGVLIIAPLITAYFLKDKNPGLLKGIVIETMSAQLATMPIIAFVFSQYSPLALPANILILPLIPLAMVLVLLAGIGGLALPAFATYVGYPASILLQYMVGIIQLLAGLPFAGSNINFTIGALVLSYAALIIAVIWLWKKTGHIFNQALQQVPYD